MTKSFWVTLRNIPSGLEPTIEGWLQERDVVPEAINMSRTGTKISNGRFSQMETTWSVAFSNDDDAMLFKLSFSQYL
jgi:hypothetical protein